MEGKKENIKNCINFPFRDCYCAHDPGRNGSESACSMGCTGDSSAKCGNNGWVSVYGTGL